MDPSSQFIVPTIIDVPELIVTNEDIDYDDAGIFGSNRASSIWSAKLQFLGTALCYIIGLGNLWHFPYLCYKYAGGAFLTAYSLVIVAVGVPLFLMELAFGQYANEGPITIWRISPAFEGIGYSMCLISAVIAIYYNLINSWILHYLFATLTFGSLPWTNCNNSWNGPSCFLNPDEPLIASPKSNCSSALVETPSQQPAATLVNASDLLVSGNCSSANDTASFDKIIKTTNEVSLPANDYFHNNVLEIDSLSGLNFTEMTCLVLVWLIVFAVLFKNLRPITSSPIILISLVMSYLGLFAMFMRALTLPGAGQGVAQYFTTDWDRLSNIDIWADAIAQVFFSLSPCWGGIITLANMNKFHNNFHSDTMLIVALNYGTSLAAGLLTFATLGYMSQYSGIKFDEVADSGIGLIFLVYPETLAQFPLANLNSFVFFATLLFLGLTSQLTVIETVLTTIIDTWPHKLRYRRPLVLAILCSCMLLLSLFMSGLGNGGFYLMQILDAFVGTLSGMFIGILELIAIAWVYGMENFMQDIDDMISVHRPLFPSRSYWYFMWRYLTPSVLFAVLLFCLTDCPPIVYRGHQLPGWSTKLGLAITLAMVAIVPAIALIRLLLVPNGSLLDRISYLCKPSEDWAPSSYVSGPKLINRHQMFDDGELRISGSQYDDTEHERPGYCSTTYTSKSDGRLNKSDETIDDDSRDDEDLKVVDGKASYIIPEEEDEDEEEEEVTGLITTTTTTNETNV
uniref:Sodium-and chloride-dependent glycine transporter 2 n=1 Tax=Aceria tosichella TaxID=561515 RepID=A0A6G1SF97_9ACAR